MSSAAPHRTKGGDGPRLVKRYQNRKLYDTTDSCYVTLEDIGELIKQGEDVQVIDNESKEDLTSVTLAQIIFETEKKQKHVLPLGALLNLVRSGSETIRDFVHKSIESGAREITNVRSELTEFVERLVRHGHLSQEERAPLLSAMRKFLEDKIRPAVESVQNIPAVQTEIRSLRQRIEELEQRLHDYERPEKV